MTTIVPDTIGLAGSWTPDNDTNNFDLTVGYRLIDNTGAYISDINTTRLLIGGIPDAATFGSSGVWTPDTV